ncbi:MAG: DUF1631 family protein [Telluria sp.]
MASISHPGIPASAATHSVPPHALLESLVPIVSTYTGEQLIAVGNRIVAALLDSSDMTATQAQVVYQRVKAGKLLKTNSFAFVRLVSKAFEQALHKEIDALLPAAAARRPSAAATLELVPFEEMDSRVAFDAVSRPFEMQYADQIATLNVRLGFLLGREILRIGQNPFRPELFLSAIHAAWREFDPDPQSHALIPPLLRPAVLFDFAPMYEALSLALMRKGVLPGSVDKHNIRKTEGAAAAKATRAREQAALSKQLRQFLAGGASEAAPALDVPLIPDLPELPKGNGGWRPSGAHGFPGAHPGPADGAPYAGAAPAPLLAMLAKLQGRAPERRAHAGLRADAFDLPRLKQSIPKGSLSRGDESTIDLLSKIFDTVFQDQNIPQEIRDLIQFLQIPVLKAALLDKNFFFEEAHPARRMIDLLSRMGLEQRKGADDPLFQAMQRSVDRVGRDFDEQLSVFSEAVAELEETLKEDEHLAASVIAQPIAAALKQEKVTAATRSARDAVAVRIGRGEVVAMLETFLENKWTSVLTVAYSVEDEKPGAVGNATKTMDELIWSVKPKITRAQRKELIAKLPGLLTTLNKWLDVIKWQDAERLQFFAELAECHASIVRAPLDLSPERQLEIAVEVAQQDAVRRIEKENAALERAEPEVDEAVIEVDALERGMWLALTDPDASVRKVKLAWISPLRTLFIFSTGTRQEAFSISSEKLAEAYREDRVRVLTAQGVVGRALSEAMGQAVNDPAIAQQLPACA